MLPSKQKAPNLKPARTLPDNLARLFEVTSQGCTAVCFIKNKIFISDNDITPTTGETEKIKLIKNVMQYFASFENDSFKGDRKKIFNEICTKRIKGEESGYINLKEKEKEIEAIANAVLDNGDWRRNFYPEFIEKLPLEKRGHAALAFEISARLKHDFVKIENFITNNKEHDLSKAFLGKEIEHVRTTKYDSISYNSYILPQNSEYGYALVSMGKAVQGDKVHAEMQMIDYLLFTELFPTKNDEKIYIGISKLCCLECALSIKACNEYANKIKTTASGKDVTNVYTDIIEKRGDHNLSSKNTQQKPIFLQMSDERAMDTEMFLRNKGYYFKTHKGKKEDEPIKRKEDLNAIVNKYGQDEVFIYQNYSIAEAIQQQPSALKRLKLASLEKQEEEQTSKNINKKPTKKISMQAYSSDEEINTNRNFSSKDRMLGNCTEIELFQELLSRHADNVQWVEQIKVLKDQSENLKKRKPEVDHTEQPKKMTHVEKLAHERNLKNQQEVENERLYRNIKPDNFYLCHCCVGFARMDNFYLCHPVAALRGYRSRHCEKALLRGSVFLLSSRDLLHSTGQFLKGLDVIPAEAGIQTKKILILKIFLLDHFY
ncbi:MAG TPA: nucleic acid/nucleotide deaminase domain-containing protein [Rickettsia endosymbiont of Pyrocoelia pectoralis]|nr:nucleic acid/nucleotide deaminase domain-containing protein [Rickettsia endosymbiont of Pyrocoelia pectoralis]